MIDKVVINDSSGLDTKLDGELSLATGSAEMADLTLPMDCQQDIIAASAECKLQVPEEAEFGIITKVNGGAYPAYEGAAEITPSEEEQILNTANKTVLQNIVINPIPSSYGRITWNGSVITVS